MFEHTEEFYTSPSSRTLPKRIELGEMKDGRLTDLITNTLMDARCQDVKKLMDARCRDVKKLTDAEIRKTKSGLLNRNRVS